MSHRRCTHKLETKKKKKEKEKNMLFIHSSIHFFHSHSSEMPEIILCMEDASVYYE